MYHLRTIIKNASTSRMDGFSVKGGPSSKNTDDRTTRYLYESEGRGREGGREGEREREKERERVSVF